MRCDCCPLSDPEDSCPLSEGELGIEHKDGMSGCRKPRNWCEKMLTKYADALGEMGLDMGIEMEFTEEELADVIEICKHMIGLDDAKPYHRHGNAYYKPYRNYFIIPPMPDDYILNRLPTFIMRSEESKINGDSVFYELTDKGLDWLGRRLKITIKHKRRPLE